MQVDSKQNDGPPVRTCFYNHLRGGEEVEGGWPVYRLSDRLAAILSYCQRLGKGSSSTLAFGFEGETTVRVLDSLNLQMCAPRKQ